MADMRQAPGGSGRGETCQLARVEKRGEAVPVYRELRPEFLELILSHEPWCCRLCLLGSLARKAICGAPRWKRSGIARRNSTSWPSGANNKHREFLQWLLEIRLEDGVDPDSVITAQTQNVLVERLSKPLPFAEPRRFPARSWTTPSRPASTVSTSSSCGSAIRPRRWPNGSMRIPEVRRFLEAASIQIRILKRRTERWCEVPVPPELLRALKLVQAHGPVGS